jgi:hypothetical protein
VLVHIVFEKRAHEYFDLRTTSVIKLYVSKLEKKKYKRYEDTDLFKWGNAFCINSDT